MQMKDTAQQERVYRLYATFFDKAEQERRWNPYRDVPYDKIPKGGADPTLITIVADIPIEAYLLEPPVRSDDLITNPELVGVRVPPAHHPLHVIVQREHGPGRRHDNAAPDQRFDVA